MKAALSDNPLVETPNLAGWLHHATSAAFRLEHEGPLDPRLRPHDQLSQLNVLVQIEHLMTYPLVRERVHAGQLHLSGWWFDIASGKVFAYERAQRSFVVIDRGEAERILGRLDQQAR